MEEFKEYIQIKRHVRVYSNQSMHAGISEVWLLLHGYGMLAKYFMQKFEVMDSLHTLMIAPEAPSRFYIDKEYQRVGASWMTKEDRLLDIEEQYELLNQVYEIYIRPYAGRVRLNVLGFSQGVATAWRWLNHSGVSVHDFIAWAGMIPQEPIQNFKAERLWLVYSKEDPLIPFLNPENSFDWLKKQEIPFEIFHYQGGHAIVEDALKELLTKLAVKT